MTPNEHLIDTAPLGVERRSTDEPSISVGPLAFSTPFITEGDIEAVVAVMRSGWITTGNECRAFEAELADYLGGGEAVAVSSATTAEEICLAYLDLPPGARVGVPNWTFVSTALAAHRVGAVPVLLDVDRDTLNLSPESLEAALIEGLDAVVGVHYGGVAFSAAIRELCEHHGVPLIEDAAHAFGTVDDRGPIRGQGTAGACLSFYATKNLATGEGGAILTDDPDLAAFARTYRLHGMSADAIDRYRRPGAHGYDVETPGLKANMPDILATLGRSQLRRFEETQLTRRLLTSRYRSGLAGLDLRVIPGEPDPGSADHLFVIDLLDRERRDRVIDALREDDIGSSVHFRPLDTFAWFIENQIPVGPSGLAVCNELDGRVMSLPLHVGLSAADVDRIVSVVSERALTAGPSRPVSRVLSAVVPTM